MQAPSKAPVMGLHHEPEDDLCGISPCFPKFPQHFGKVFLTYPDSRAYPGIPIHQNDSLLVFDWVFHGL